MTTDLFPPISNSFIEIMVLSLCCLVTKYPFSKDKFSVSKKALSSLSIFTFKLLSNTFII